MSSHMYCRILLEMSRTLRRARSTSLPSILGIEQSLGLAKSGLDTLSNMLLPLLSIVSIDLLAGHTPVEQTQQVRFV